MGKVKRQARKNVRRKDDRINSKSKPNRRSHSQVFNLKSDKNIKPGVENKSKRISSKAKFGRLDNVLLVGEGDFSFALSLVQHHRPGALIATCYDTEEQVRNKYPQAVQTIENLRSSYTDLDSSTESGEVDWNGFSPSPTSNASDRENDPSQQVERRTVDVCFGIDATKLSSSHKKQFRSKSPFTKIVFNFPHVGGLSTDVNRQVRSNQELLVGFFNSAKPLLSSQSRPAVLRNTGPHDLLDLPDEQRGTVSQHTTVAVKGEIMVTLFEREPYTLWNIRDLARHCGLQVIESFVFPWAAYPGYQHARTVGNIVNGKDRSLEGKRMGAWRGEERDARCFVLQVKDDDTNHSNQEQQKKRKATNKVNTDSDSDTD